jgi:hypothetical protein
VVFNPGSSHPTGMPLTPPSARSFPVNTARTPECAIAREASTFTMRA